MSSYGYGPPPPPPSANPAGYGHPSGPYSQQGSSRGGGQHGRGRGGHYGGRGEYHASPPAHYDYARQQPYPGHQPPAHYTGSQPQPVSYQQPPPQWSSEHAHAQHHHPHAPQPLSAANYHPNYAPQPYAQTGQYSQTQQPAYGAPQQYGPAYPSSSPPSVPHWSGSAPAPAPAAAYPSTRGRGGYNDRGQAKPHHGGPRSGRPSYDHEQVPPVAHGNYSQPYPHDPRASHYPPQHYAYPAPPPPPEPVVRHEPYYVQSGSNRRGRGGRDHGGRGRGGHHGGHHGADKARHQQRKTSHQENGQQKTADSQAVGKKKKRKTNTLGLTPGNESESEDDEGEEKVLTELIGKEALVIKDVAEYLAERKKRFPTKARVEAKKAAESAQAVQDKAADLEKQADKLRKQLRKVESSIKRKREQGDEGDEMRESPPADSSDDDKPEELSSKSPKATTLPPPAKKADISKHCKYYSTGGSCGKKGKCRFRHDPEVREAAIKEREANNGRLTIQQRLILNDKDQEDLTVLQSIQYLREKGLMSAAEAEAKKDMEDVAKIQAPEAKDDSKPEAKAEPPKPQTQQPTTSLLPAPPPSLPPPPAKREPVCNGPTSTSDSSNTKDVKHYEGWLLKPYGGKSDDLP